MTLVEQARASRETLIAQRKEEFETRMAWATEKMQDGDYLTASAHLAWAIDALESLNRLTEI